MEMEMERHPTTSTTTGRRSCSNGFLRRLPLTIVSIFVLLMAIIGIAWFVMDPHDPSFRITSLSVSNFTVSDSHLRGKFEVELTMKNPNKRIKVVLDRFNVLVCYGQVDLWVAEAQPMYLEKMTNKTIKVDLEVKNSPKVVHKVVLENLVEDWNKRVVNFDVKMMVRSRFDSGVWPSKEKFLDVYCGDLDVGFFTPKDTGKLLGIGKDCHVRVN